MHSLDLVVALVAGIALGLLVAAVLDDIERREADRLPAAP